MKVFFLGAYSDKGREGMMASSYDARVKAVSSMVERAGAKLGSVDYLRVHSMSLLMLRLIHMRPLLGFKP